MEEILCPQCGTKGKKVNIVVDFLQQRRFKGSNLV